MLLLDLCKLLRHERQRLIPGDLHVGVTFAQQWCVQAVGGVHKIVAEFALHAGRDAVGWPVLWLDLQDVAVARPNLERAAHTTVGAHRFGAFLPRHAHLGFHVAECEDGRIAGLRFHALHDLDHVVQHLGRQIRQVARVAQHGLFHECIAGANRNAVAAGDAGRSGDLFAAIPQDTRMLAAPVDRQCFVYLHILAGLHAAAAQDALVGVVAIERIGVVLRVRLVRIWP